MKMNIKFGTLVLIMLFSISGLFGAGPAPIDFTSYVNPLLGTDEH